MIDDNKRIGIGLCALGVFLILLGCMFLFDRGLLALGNLAFLSGLLFLLGIEKAAKFFWKKKVPAALFFGGNAIIIYGYGFIGFCLELWGLWQLFVTFLPNVIYTLKLVPVIGPALSIWPLSLVVDKIQDTRRLPV